MLQLLEYVVPWLVTNAPRLVQSGISIVDLVDKVSEQWSQHRVVGDPAWDKLEEQIELLQEGTLRDTSRDA